MNQDRLTTGRERSSAISKLRAACLQRGAQGIKGFGRTFRIYDDDGNKALSREELAEGIRDYGVHLTADELNELFLQFDTDGTGNINFDEFLIHLRPPMSQSRIDIIKKAFQKMDRTGDGHVTMEDLKDVYNYKEHPKFKSGEFTKAQVFQQFMNTFQTGKNAVVDEKITFEEFLNYYAGVSASIDNDAYFDLMMRQAWKI